ncbi:dCTP deaminase [Hyphomicrobium sp. CS1GBMeth3]|uniref:dCTP deaminase n=1 Tax=Hyphomicrobium sp. CS1GBMeth3 TaxID=1892845 RepID=UPI0009313874|nr:dCTP deaminase [Hyphomicrobium sp. CS1GBMeth3]
MILTDKEIGAALDAGQLVIQPRPPSAAFSSTSIDLTLANVFAEWPKAEGLIIQPGKKGYKYSAVANLQNTIEASTYTLDPHQFVLGWTAEKVSLLPSSQLAARVEGKSSLARLGLCVHMTAPTVHAGFGKDNPLTIQLEMVNFGPNTLILDAGMTICQLIFERTGGEPDKPYEGQFSDQKAEASPKRKR